MAFDSRAFFMEFPTEFLDRPTGSESPLALPLGASSSLSLQNRAKQSCFSHYLLSFPEVTKSE